MTTSLTQTQQDMLKRFGHFPRCIVYFTTIGNAGFAQTADRAQENLDALEAAGLIFKHKYNYKLTQAGRNYVDSKGHMGQVVPVRNSTSQEAYTSPAWHVRTGGDDHLAIASRGGR